jgi:hypothetical protein
MNHRAKCEINSMMKMGIDEDIAKISVYKKYGYNTGVEELKSSLIDENQCLAEDTFSLLVPFEEISINIEPTIAQSMESEEPEPEPEPEPIKRSTLKRVNGKLMTVYS